MDVPPPRCISHNIVHHGENIELLKFPEEFINFTPTSFDINQVVLLWQFLVPGRVSLRFWTSVVTFFLESWFEFLSYKKLGFIRFYWLFMMSKEVDFLYWGISLNESNKLIKLWKFKVCPCKMCQTFFAQISFAWS